MSRKKTQKAAHRLRRKLEALLKEAANGNMYAKNKLEELSQSLEVKRMLSTINAGKATDTGLVTVNKSKVKTIVNSQPMQGGSPGLGKRK